MSGADTVVERSTEVIEAEQRAHTKRLRRTLEKAAALIEPELAAGVCLHEYDALAGMEAARQGVHLVATKDKIERTHLRRLANQYGHSAVDEILDEAWLALCTPISPLFGVWLSPWFLNPAKGYKLTLDAINLARKNWTNRRHRFPELMDALLGAVLDGDDEARDFNERMPDTRAETADDEAHLQGLIGKLSAFLETLTADECRVAELLVEERSVANVMALTGESKYAVQQMRKRLEAEFEEYRPAPAGRSKRRQSRMT